MTDDQGAPAPAAAPVAPAAAKPRSKRPRGFLAGFLVVLFSISLLLSLVSTWAVRQVLNNGAFTKHVTTIVADPSVQQSMATYLTTEVVKVIDPQKLVENVLPTRLDPLAGPVVTSVQTFVTGQVEKLLATPQFQKILVTAISRTHEAAVNLLEGQPVGNLEVHGNEVVLNTIPLINEVLQAIGQHGIFGHSFTVPPISSSTAAPSAQVQQLATHFGVTLGPEFGQIVVFQSDRISEAQSILRRVHRLLIGLAVLTILLLILAFVVSPRRRRTAIHVGIGVAVVMIATYVAVQAITNDVVAFVKSPASRTAARVVTSTLTSGLTTFALWLAALGLAAAVVAFLLGDTRTAGAVRGWLATAARAVVSVTAAHPDGARVLGGIVAVAVLVFAGLHWPGIIATLVVAVAWQAGVSLVVRQHPASTSTSPPAPAAS